MKLDYPFTKPFTTTQGFNENKNTYYAEKKMTGHGGYDCFKYHQAPIYASVDAYCYLIANTSDPMKYSAVYTLAGDSGVSYEVSYGHIDEAYCEVGPIKKGQKIASQGNKGDTSSGGRKTTREEKLAGSGAGSHLHFQVRVIKKSDVKERSKQYIYGGQKIQGFYYEIPYYNNGTKGCIDPSQFFTGKYPLEVAGITVTLRYGSRGEAVKSLQRKLKIKVDGSFGVKTEQAVKDFQKKNGLKVDGICGHITRLKLGL